MKWEVCISDIINRSFSIPRREAFPEFAGNEPGTCLAASRSKNGMTQAVLCELTGIPRRHLSEMEKGKRPVGKMTAKKLSAALDTDYLKVYNFKIITLPIANQINSNGFKVYFRICRLFTRSSKHKFWIHTELRGKNDNAGDAFK